LIRAATEAEANHKAYLEAIKEGNAAYSAGGFDKAIANFSEAIRFHPDDASAFNSRGNAYAGKGNLYRAIADYNEAIRLKPNYALAFCNRGNCETETQQPRR
jgi:Flp pilus assembly protein TadD